MGQKQYWNIVKGLGIIAIVIGHTGSPLWTYVYMYHLALFFFVSGYLYKEKYSPDPFGYIANRLRRIWWPLVQYGAVYALLHNVFLRINIYSNLSDIPKVTPMKEYHLYDLFVAIKQILFMQSIEEMGGAMWFIFPLFMVMACFCFIQKLSLIAKGWKREVIVASLVIISGLLGIWLFNGKIKLEYRLDVSLLVLPIVYAGFLTRRVWDRFPLKWYVALITLITVIVIYKYTGSFISLAQQILIGPKWFFLASFAGIYFNLYLAKIIQSSQAISRRIAYLGEQSFHIMALHFLSFKIINVAYVMFYDKPYHWIAKFPFIDSNWWIAYTVAGIVGSVVCVEVFAYFKSRYKKYMNIDVTV